MPLIFERQIAREQSGCFRKMARVKDSRNQTREAHTKQRIRENY